MWPVMLTGSAAVVELVLHYRRIARHALNVLKGILPDRGHARAARRPGSYL